MGRRKIEIKAIKDDRNRSVTFLKRKGGLFKKAHELSVLCSVDVAVIIFGHNKKLYEFSSGDINETIGRYQYYGQAHEHKGPADFNGKRDLDDDDDDDVGTPPPEEQLTHEPSLLPPHLQDQPGYQHMRTHAPSASPPTANGVAFPHRQHTPQPQNDSRPSSRNNVRRTSSLVPQHHPQVSQPPRTQNGFAYMPNPTIYNPHGMPAPPSQAQQQGQPPFFQYPAHPTPHHPSQQPQMQQVYMQDQRRQSMPPAFPQQERPQQTLPDSSPPQTHAEQSAQEQPLQQPKPLPVKSRSIFTPIEDTRSLLAQHSWGIGTLNAEPARGPVFIKTEKDNRAQSVDVGSVQRNNGAGATASGPRSQRGQGHPQRNQSISSVSDIAAPSRTNSAQLGAKRPQLKVQIPSEQSDGGSATAESSPHESGGTTGETPAKGSTEASHSSGVVLPPPSPSASALLSAGAQGPPNPFARPPPPTSTGNQNSNAYNNNNNIETPISALPSRFVADGLLPSPSSFYPDWGFGRPGGDSNMLPSPLNFQTPVVSTGPSFLRDEDMERKRKSPEGEGREEVGSIKRVKT
ncbi:hypothetical protein MMC16_000341 [Acarospora aff. strigata]|nr:hypothetical protein [Acarospora aff. strigata]